MTLSKIQKLVGWIFIVFAAFCFISATPLKFDSQKLYPAQLVEVYVGGQVAGRSKHSNGYLTTQAQGVFKNKDNTFTTANVDLSTAYKWEQGERNMMFMLPLPDEENERQSKLVKLLISAVGFLFMGLVLIIFRKYEYE